MNWFGLLSTLCLGATPLAAQETNQVEQLKKRLQELQSSFQKIQEQQRQQIEALQKQIEALQRPQPAATNLANAVAPSVESKSWSPAQPVTLARAGAAYMNVSFDGVADLGWSTASDPSAQLQLGDHDPIQRGFSLRNAEIALDGAVDPYFKGFANIVFKLDKDNETELELEEVFAQSTSLPANLQLKGGQFFAAFGRQNPQHPHAWAFVDQPLILNRLFGPDGLRNVGAQLSWLLPTSFYTEAFLGVLNGEGGTAFSFRDTGPEGTHGRAALSRGLRGAGDLLFVPRVASSFELTDTQTLVVGASGAFGPNDTGPHTRTEIYGVDAYWKWKSASANAGFPFVSWQTEALYRRFGAGSDAAATLPTENLQDWGLYSQVLWGIKPRWVAGLRGEFVDSNAGAFDSLDPFRGSRARISPNLTWYPSEYSKLRLQYNYDQDEFFDDGHSVWLQFEFLLGAHAAHKF